MDYAKWIWWVIHHEQYEEIQGLVDGVNNENITMAEALIVNLVYEATAYCTSIVA